MSKYTIISSGTAYVDPIVVVHRASCSCSSVERALRDRREWSLVSAVDETDARVQAARMVRHLGAVQECWSDCTLFPELQLSAAELRAEHLGREL